MPQFDLAKSTSLHSLPLTGDFSDPDLIRLEELIELSARLLPAEGPVGSFAFQNPLHAMEYLPFDQGLQIGSRLFGCEPYLSAAFYRGELDRKRVLPIDLRAVLEEEDRPWEVVAGLTSRLGLWMAMLTTPALVGAASEIKWYLAEMDALAHFPANIPTAARDQVVADAKRWVIKDIINAGSLHGGYREPGPDDPRRGHILWPLMPHLRRLMRGQEATQPEGWAEPIWEEFALRSLWRVCAEGVRSAGERPAQKPAHGERPRDVLLRATGADSDVLVNDLLIRFAAAFTDQGLSQWVMPGRERGFFAAFADLYQMGGGSVETWLRGLPAELERLREAGMGPIDSIRESLQLLGIPEENWEGFLPATVLTLRGWASMIRQMEVRADRVPLPSPRGTLTGFLAVRLILERLALAHLGKKELGYTGPLSGLAALARARAEPRPSSRSLELTFLVFQLAQMSGWAPSALYGMDGTRWAALVREIEAFSDLDQRRVFHKAFERRLRIQTLDAFHARTSKPPTEPGRVQFQSVYCIDAREESFRRHLEEVCPQAETFGAAGFFSVAMYYRGAAEAHPAANCPIVVRPQHWVTEEPALQLAEIHEARARMRRLIGTTSHQLHAGSRSAGLGALITGALGALATVPLVARVLFPRVAAWVSRRAAALVAPPLVTRLHLERKAPAPGPEPDAIGFNLEEMTNISERVLRDIGLTSRFSRLVIFFGHGSHSMNNPHLAAYHCGACSGNPGGANARALAMMLNNPEVRVGLASRGLPIPADTFFVGGFHDTGDDTFSFHDLDLLPASHVDDLRQAIEALNLTCRINARERCRRFHSAPLSITPEDAHTHVHVRTEDLAQTRAEYGNASNSMCYVGRRSRVRGLFMDRRAFMHSYDPHQDGPTGPILARILSAVIPVCQGINMVYFLSSVDPQNWGCSTKLPQNVTSMLGVMDGMRSDLRQGLPAQGTDIHEPVRCLFVIETKPEVMLTIMKANQAIDLIIRNDWSQLALLDPDTAELKVWENGEFVPHYPTTDELPTRSSSSDWYTGSRDHLEFAHIEPSDA